MSEWKTYRLGEIAEDIAMGPFGSNLKVDNFIDSGVPVIRGMNLNEGGFSNNSFAFVSEEKANSLKRCLAYPDDLVFTHRGTLGQVGIIPHNAYPKYLVSQSQMRLRVQKDKLLPKFLYYFFKSPLGQRELLKNSSQVGVPAIANPTKSLKQVEITIPSLATQRQIAQILSSLDDKIELNLQMNQTLEAMAQAIFKEWFVNFNFPESLNLDSPDLHDEQDFKKENQTKKDQGNQGNPKNQGSDNLPKGWRMVSIGELFKVTIGGDWGKEEFSDEFPENSFVVRGTDFDKILNGNIGSVPNRFIKKSNFLKRQIENGDILLEISGGSKDQPTGRTILFTDELLSLFDSPVVPASFCRLIRPKDFNHSLFLDTFFKNFYQIGGTWEYQNQSTGISNFQFTFFSENKKIAVPESENLIYKFSEIIKPMKKRIDENTLQIQTLTQLRDTLLPKLMSGSLNLDLLDGQDSKDFESQVNKNQSNQENPKIKIKT